MTPPNPPPPTPASMAASASTSSRRTRRGFIAAATALALTVLGVAASAAAVPSAAGPAGAAQPQAAAGGLPLYDHVVVVMEENKFYDDIVGSKDAPYINSLATQGASFSNFHGTTHPSQGNYVALFSGSTHGVADDDCPHDFSADNLGNQLLTSGHTFVGYSEALPSDGSKDCGDDGDSGYARKHNGWVDFADIPAASNLRYSRFPTDYTKLPTVSFVTPTLNDDMHDGTVKQGDTWLKSNFDGYIQWAKTHNSALVLTWDEDDGDDSTNQIATMIVGARVKPGATSATKYTHYSLLRTLEDMYGLPALGSAASASAISGIWDTSGTPTTKPPTTPPTTPPTSPPTSPPAGGANLALNRPTTTSSTESTSLGGANAVDGKSTTRWGSKEGTDPQWISVDLGRSTALSRVKLSWEAAYGKAYSIQTSDDNKTWTTVYSTASGNGGTDDLTLSGTGRYVRMYGTKRGTSYGYSLYEFEVYGTAAAAAKAGAGAGAVQAAVPRSTGDLTDPRKREIALEVVSSAANSSLDWKEQYTYIDDIGDGRGYTAGIAGFHSSTGDLLALVELYTRREPHNVLAGYLPALRRVDGSHAHTGLGAPFTAAWHRAAADPVFRTAQDDELNRESFDPAVAQAKADGLHALGQFVYFDALVTPGPGAGPAEFARIRATALRQARTPAQGGDETAYLDAFLTARTAAMRADAPHGDTSRVDTEQRVFLDQGDLDLNPSLSWHTYGDPYTIAG
ncbi:chitosanase [Streptacidiphilus sp. N1-12]|uniref:phospholipase C n=2 Tax=Streptacidiphilus alkalitolerans TaxID=3342712 RepID=A0ABV6WMC2_9ACTN